MSNTLQEAIAAVRAGDMNEAQTIAANVVRDNPNDPNGWYLLSQLVDSDARRAAYLGKTLALDPSHPRARIEFDALPPALTADLAPAATAPAVASAESEWIDQGVTEAEIAAAAQRVEAAAAGAPAWDAPTGTDLRIDERPEDLPEWLQPLSPEPVAAVAAEPAEPYAATAATTAAVRPKPAPAKKATPAKKNGGNQALSILLGLLALLTVVVLVFLFYLLFF